MRCSASHKLVHEADGAMFITTHNVLISFAGAVALTPNTIP
jgi:hypothetical protein